ncbi:MmgE/PrpD family protein [Paenibacillus sp. S150]|uniref:MmgE/PrpD family protein n=1 Tax=Paenibacillus sp. S150 TaxID=2749826 RepID=UPI001C58C302|nr:MmgE/PrpD family protein [Paenibacillus sp. S150]MBW4079812.1 MmgE/PrpD family protein [Paenibacillus sp. S150]
MKLGVFIAAAIERQARFVDELTFGQLPDHAIRAAKTILLDSIGCMAAGSNQLKTSYINGISRHGNSKIIGTSESCSPEWAAFMNGCNLVATELDEGNQYAKGHPAAHFLPALLAEAQILGCSGKEFLTAFVAAYEIAVRWGSAVTLAPSVHPHGNWGTASAAAAVAKLRGAGSEKLQEIIYVSSSLPMTSAWNSALNGANVRNAYIGASNMLGWMAPAMAELGIASDSSVLSQLYGEILGRELKVPLLQEGLGEQFYIESNYMKIHACCRFGHGAIDAVIAMREDGIKLGSVERVSVETYGAASRLVNPLPVNPLAAKFSIPFSLAILLSRGSIGEDQFTPETVADPEIRQRAARVAVSEDPLLTALLPDERATRVTLYLPDGTSRTKEIRAALGEFSNPLEAEQLAQKFHTLSSPVWDRERRERIHAVAMNIEQIEDIGRFTDLLVNETG